MLLCDVRFTIPFESSSAGCSDAANLSLSTKWFMGTSETAATDVEHDSQVGSFQLPHAATKVWDTTLHKTFQRHETQIEAEATRFAGFPGLCPACITSSLTFKK